MSSVNTLTARGMFCDARHNHHTFTPIIIFFITTTANKHPGKKSFIDNNMRKSHWHQAVHITKNKLATSRGPPLKSYCPHKSNYKNYLQKKLIKTPPAYSPGHYHPDPFKIPHAKN